MNDPKPSGPAVPPPAVVANSRLWLLVLLGLLAFQGWWTFGLFGGSWETLADDRPIVSGRHPLHLYHGHLGARTLLERGSVSCFDPAFHAGYPKTPVFDAGSRPAEIVLALVGGDYRPAAYKIGLAVFCLLVPAIVFVSARAIGLARGPAVAATLLAQLVWWGQPGRQTLEAGDIDLLLGGVALLAHLGFLVRYHRCPCIFSLLGVVVSGLVAWLAHPFLAALLLPLMLIYYFSVGARHRLGWHAPLFFGLVMALAGNAFWLLDWVSYWWILVPPVQDPSLPRGGALWKFWELPLWGAGLERALVVLLVLAAVVGIGVLHKRGRRQAAMLLGPAFLGLLALAVFGSCREPFARFGAAHLLIPALLFAALPAGAAVASGMGFLRRWSGSVACPLVVLAGVPALVFLVVPGASREWGRHLVAVEPLAIGLGAERSALVKALQEKTDDQARILWEDQRQVRGQPRWAALLPQLTNRAFIGGLDADVCIEHATTGLVEQRLTGRPIDEWSDVDLDAYCRRYNIGWVVCRTPASVARFRRYPAALAAQELPAAEGVTRWLVPIQRPHSFALAGSAQWKSADALGILLSDVVPQAVPGEPTGQIVLSLHYQAGMRVRPARIRLEQAVDPQDAIPFVRLRMDEPVGRVIITWDGR